MTSASSPDPSVAVVIVNWNSGAMLCRAVEALAGQGLSCRIVVVDNASTDNSMELMSSKFPEVGIINANANLGFAAANNLAVRQLSAYDWIAFLNPDAFPERGWLNGLVNAVRANPDYSCFASRVVFDADPGILDGAGDEYHVSGFAWRRGHGLGADTEPKDREVFMASATAALYRRAAFEHAGGFDKRYFCYYEDVDLGVRLRLLGYRSRYVADAVVRHVGSGITGRRSAFVTYHTQRNRIWTYLKNMPGPLLLITFPLHLAYQLLAFARYAAHGQLGPALRGTLDAVRGLGEILPSRRITQSTAIISWVEFANSIRWDLLAPIRR